MVVVAVVAACGVKGCSCGGWLAGSCWCGAGGVGMAMSVWKEVLGAAGLTLREGFYLYSYQGIFGFADHIGRRFSHCEISLCGIIGTGIGRVS